MSRSARRSSRRPFCGTARQTPSRKWTCPAAIPAGWSAPMPSLRSSTVRSPAGAASTGPGSGRGCPPTPPRPCWTSGAAAGDVPVLLARWAARDGLRLEVTAIDPDPRASLFARGRHASAGVTFRQANCRGAGRRGPPLRRRGVQPRAAPPRRAGTVPCRVGHAVPRHGGPQRHPPQCRRLRALLCLRPGCSPAPTSGRTG